MATLDLRQNTDLHRCSNPECRLYGVRVWTAAGSTYTCRCGDPGTSSDVAKRHLAPARESLKRRPA